MDRHPGMSGKERIQRLVLRVVLIDPVTAKGCRDLVQSCLYKAIFWNEHESRHDESIDLGKLELA